MNSTKFRLMFQSLIFQPRMLRSVQAIALISVLVGTSGSIALAQSQRLTWQAALERLFGRQQQKGGTRGGTAFCAATPIFFNSPNNSSPRLLLTEKPLIAWYGNIGSIRLYNRTTKKEWIHTIPPVPAPVTSPSTPAPSASASVPAKNELVLNQLQYDGEPLSPGHEHDLSWRTETPDKSSKPVTVYSSSFRTLRKFERDRTMRQLKTLEANAIKTNSDPVLPQVEFLLQQNLVNDAQMLILQQTNPSPELQAAIAATQNPCEMKLKPKGSPSPTP